MSRARAGFYGDDFTGSVDVLLQFARAGWRGRLFVGMPSPDALAQAAGECDVVGIAGIARSLDPDVLTDEVRPALQALAALRPRVVQYKACSTADSSPEIGSLGRVIEVARDVFGDATVPLLFAQPDFGRYTAFGHHFAAEGGVVYRLDRQPTMSRHPVTPMTESDLAVHLGRQTELPIGSIPFTAYMDVAGLVHAIRSAPDAAVVLDATTDEHVRLAGAAVAALDPEGVTFALGSGGLSTGLAAAFASAAVAGAAPAAGFPGAALTGPVLAVSGSRSPQTARQLADAADHGWLVLALPIEPTEAIDDVIAALRAGRSVALTSDGVALPGDRPAVDAIAAAAASVIETAVRAGATRRVIVCGGDTSSRITGLLGAESLRIVENPAGNLVLLAAEAREPWLDGLELMLKGGQVGPVDLFELVRGLGGPATSGIGD